MRQQSFALLGTGLVAPFHAQAIANSNKCNLVAVADVNEERRNAFAEEYGCKAYTGLDDILSDDTIDIVNVLTPNHLHFEAVQQIADSGKHILVEKPPAMSLHEVDEMIRVTNENGVKLGIVLQCRVRPAIQVLRKAISQNRFGKVLQADAYMKWFRSSEYYHRDPWRSSRKSGAGVTIQHAFHYLDLLCYLAGPVENVYARMKNMAHPDVELEDSLVAFLDFKNGAQGVVEASTALWPGTDIRIELNGTDGTAIIVGERIAAWDFRTKLDEDDEIRKIGSAEVATAATGPADFSYGDHQIVIEDMVDAINDDRDPVIPAISTRDTLEAALAMYQSARKKCAIHLPLQDENSVWD